MASIVPIYIRTSPISEFQKLEVTPPITIGVVVADKLGFEYPTTPATVLDVFPAEESNVAVKVFVPVTVIVLFVKLYCDGVNPDVVMMSVDAVPSPFPNPWLPLVVNIAAIPLEVAPPIATFEYNGIDTSVAAFPFIAKFVVPEISAGPVMLEANECRAGRYVYPLKIFQFPLFNAGPDTVCCNLATGPPVAVAYSKVGVFAFAEIKNLGVVVPVFLDTRYFTPPLLTCFAATNNEKSCWVILVYKGFVVVKNPDAPVEIEFNPVGDVVVYVGVPEAFVCRAVVAVPPVPVVPAVTVLNIEKRVETTLGSTCPVTLRLGLVALFPVIVTWSLTANVFGHV